jgi:hypothetical protein
VEASADLLVWPEELVLQHVLQVLAASELVL